MDILALIIVFFILILLYLILTTKNDQQNNNNNKIESLLSVKGENSYSFSVLSEEAKNSGTPQNRIPLLEDPSFSDVIFYTNDDNPYVDNQKIGLQKCFDQCNGTCVEFGITGSSFCFKNQN